MYETLERLCLITSRSECNWNRCGRTDKGVSAYGNVVSLYVRSNLSKSQLEKEKGDFIPPKLESEQQIEEKQSKIVEEVNYIKVLNRALPDYIRVVSWAPVDKDFNARFSCKSRSYRYFFFKGSYNIEVIFFFLLFKSAKKKKKFLISSLLHFTF